MTRLNEALERARGGSETQPPAQPLPPTTASAEETAVVPNNWHFDETNDELPLADPRAASSEEPDDDVLITSEDLAQVEYSFAKSPSAASRLVVGPAPNDILVEQFRHLAAALHHSQLRSGTKTVMIASAVEAEGKTTTAANLALTFSHSHRRRVLLVDADLRRPSIHSLFQLDNREGLNEALKIVTPNTPLPLHHISPTLSVLTAGHPTPDPMSALVSEMMKQFIVEASQQYDWVILDTPPVAILSDANLLAAMIDTAIIVVSANTTPYPLVRRAVAAIGPTKVLGTVLNRAKRPGFTSRYHYGYSYAYSYRYRPKEELPRARGWWPFRRAR